MTAKNKFDWKHFSKLTKKRFRRKFKKPIKSREIRMIWDNWVQSVVDKVIEGGEVKLDKYQSLEIVGTSIWEDPRFVNLLSKGKGIKGGKVLNAEMNSRRKNVKYKIVYKHSMNPNLYFNAKFSGQVHDAIVNTNNYYRIT